MDSQAWWQTASQRWGEDLVGLIAFQVAYYTTALLGCTILGAFLDYGLWVKIPVYLVCNLGVWRGLSYIFKQLNIQR